MQVGGKDDRCREDTTPQLALTFTVELLPPLIDHEHIRLITYQHLSGLPVTQQEITEGGILHGVIGVEILDGIRLSCVCCPLHQGTDIDPCNSNREKTDSGQH